jgi:penicillin V acylase-like amidase (Ntn superfamily)
MARRRLAALVGLGLAVLVATPGLSCTTVCLLEQEKAVVAYNYDFHPSEGLVLVNKRGTKTISALRTQAAAWTAAYGSVTFNQFGRDNPMTGINEKGLVVAQMWLDKTRYPPADARPAIGILEWIQYNLDRHASVAEVVTNAEAVRPTSRSPIHYLVADAGGDTATLEFLDEKLVIHRGATMPVRALANSTYADSVAAFERAKSSGVMPVTVSSIDRFVRAAMLAGKGGAEPIGRGFEILASVAQPHFTRWSVVYDMSAREVHFRTEGNQAIRRLALAGLDFSCATPVKMLDVTAGGAGDVDAALADYTMAANRALIESSFAKTPFLREVPAAVKDALAAHPSVTSSCAPADSRRTPGNSSR